MPGLHARSRPTDRRTCSSTTERTSVKTPAVEVTATPTVEPQAVVAPPEPLTCRQAVEAVWPPDLQANAIVVLDHENRSNNPEAVGVPNFDGSRDYGCFQINDKWHSEFFANNDWRDPVANATYALKIYQERQASSGNGWTAWYAVSSVLW